MNGKKTHLFVVLSELPQILVLGSQIILVLIGDVDEKISKAFISSFAGDTKAGNSYLSKIDAVYLKRT